MLYVLLVVAAIFSAFQVMRSPKLLTSTIWLAATSALVSMIIYMLGAPEVAVIELSVGAGLVTILFVFAFSIVGELTLDEVTIVPRALVWGMVLLAAFLLGWFTFPIHEKLEAFQLPFSKVLWEQRGLDVMAQIVLIFAGVMGLLGLMTETRKPVAAQTARILEEEETPPELEQEPETAEREEVMA